MDAVELIARFALAAVFLVAGLAKLADRPGSRAALEGFGLPDRLAIPGAIALPVAELATAVLLIPATTATIGAASALVLLLGFCAGISRSMARGEAPDCHCFGQLHSEPVGLPTLLRNLALLALAALVLALGSTDPAPPPSHGRMTSAAPDWSAIGGALAILAILAVAASVLMGLLRRHGALLLRVEALEAAVAEHGIVVEVPAADGARGRGAAGRRRSARVQAAGGPWRDDDARRAALGRQAGAPRLHRPRLCALYRVASPGRGMAAGSAELDHDRADLPGQRRRQPRQGLRTRRLANVHRVRR